MSLLSSEPFGAVETMEELFAIASRMEQEAIANYTELADRMRREQRPDLVAVFERLAEEEAQHLNTVVEWSERTSGAKPDLSKLRWQPAGTFDDEGASSVAAELLSAYRMFSMAVRNEERAFLFWTYVAAQADDGKLRLAAEQMAREELGHLTTLRRERRRAFHAEKDRNRCTTATGLPELEQRLAEHLLALAASRQAEEAPDFAAAAEQARGRVAANTRKPFGQSPLLKAGVAPDVTGRAAALCELLLDCYLDFAARAPSEEEQERAQRFAGQLIACRSAIRAAST